MNYDAADQFLRNRLNVPTRLKSAGIPAALPAEIRAHAFFSARVAEAHVLDKIRDVSDRYSRGEISQAMARGEIKSWLQKQGGYDLDDNRVANLAGTARLNLVLRQNARMAQAVGDYQVSRDPDIEERFPYWRYIARPGARGTHAAYHGKVFAKSDPIWKKIFPPWEFNCRCSVEDVAADEVDRPDRMPDPPVPESGYQFDPARAFVEHDLSAIRTPATRRDIMRQVGELSRRERIDFVATPGPTPPASPPLTGGFDRAGADAWLQKQLEASASGSRPDDAAMQLGTFSRELTDGLGLEAPPVIEMTRSRTISHAGKRHADQLADGNFSAALAETLGSQRVQVSYQVKSGQQDMINVRSLDTDAFVTLRRRGASETWDVLSAHKLGTATDAEYYRNKQMSLGPK